VFVLVPESVELGERVSERKIASTVWLKPLDQCPVAHGQLAHPAVPTSPKPSVIGDRPVKRETRPHNLARDAESSKLEHRVIESGRKVVNNIADSRAELQRRMLFDLGDKAEALLPLVVLHRGAVRVIPKVRVHLRVKRLEMFKRRVELREDPVIWVRR
jgi:hypothetical protein